MHPTVMCIVQQWDGCASDSLGVPCYVLVLLTLNILLQFYGGSQMLRHSKYKQLVTVSIGVSIHKKLVKLQFVPGT